MSRILIYTAGTLGDHLPFFALAQALQRRGHEVVCAVNASMQTYAQRARIPFHALVNLEGGEEEARLNAWCWNFWNGQEVWDHQEPQATDTLSPLALSDTMVRQCKELRDLCLESDLLISTSIRFGGLAAALTSGIPWITASMNPNVFCFSEIEAERRQQHQNCLWEHRTVVGILDGIFRQLGAGKKTFPYNQGWFWAPLVLLAASPHFAAIDTDQLRPQNRIVQTGFWFYQDPEWDHWQPDRDLNRFLQADEDGKGPLVLTFSSQPLQDPVRILHRHVETAVRLRRRLLVQKGWAGFREEDLPSGVDRSRIRFTDFLPHDFLFSHAAASIQHGGIGSLARSLRQGCPLLLEPFGNDQLYNASQAEHLGVAAVVHPLESTVDMLVEALHDRVLTPQARKNAGTMAQKLRGEDGLSAACACIEDFMEKQDQREKGIWIRPPALPGAEATDRILSPPPLPAQGNIPFLFHQIWKNQDVPEELAACSRTWQAQHPQWTFYLWDDIDGYELIRRDYDWFLPVYESYRTDRQRYEAMRYFLLHRFGGVYTDLDFECLRSIRPLLEGKEIVLAEEPEVHRHHRSVGHRGFSRIVGNAFLASLPRHPFWEHVIHRLVGCCTFPPPHSTGAYMLTAAVESYGASNRITLLPSSCLYPISMDVCWNRLPEEDRQTVRDQAYGVHHWRSRGCREEPEAAAETLPASLMLSHRVVNEFALSVVEYVSLMNRKGVLPRISCLMPTRNRFRLAQQAIRCFLEQTYPNREMIILDNSETDELQDWVAALGEPSLRYFRKAGRRIPLGSLRNLSMQEATGDFVTNWDDDDLSHPQRLEIQMAALWVHQADACLLQCQYLWYPQPKRLAISNIRLWENSSLLRKSCVPEYDTDAWKGEDTAAIEHIVNHHRVIHLYAPHLYINLVHGANSFQDEHWSRHWQSAQSRFTGERYTVQLAELARSLRFDPAAYEEGLLAPTVPAPTGDRPAPPASTNNTTPGPDPEDIPSILIAILWSDALQDPDKLLSELAGLTYPGRKISLAFLLFDGSAGMEEALDKKKEEWTGRFARLSVVTRDYGFAWRRSFTENRGKWIRSSLLSRCRNFLMHHALAKEDWILWLDARVARIPPDLVERLLKARKEIVVPNCVLLGTGQSFDLSSYKWQPQAGQIDWQAHVIEGLLDPPAGLGRWYLNDLALFDCVELDGVGSSTLLVRADLHREGLIFPFFPYKNCMDSEGLAAMARDMGYRCWGLPKVQVPFFS